MLKGIDVKERAEVVYSKDPDKENPTKFFIGNLTHSDKIALFAGAIKADKSLDFSAMSSKTVDIVKAGLKAIKNLDGKDYEPVPADVLESLPFEVLGEITGKIMEFNFMKEQEVKN